VIAMDDGWRSVYDIAYPILKKYGFPATLFVYTDLIDTENGLSWGQLSELEENGIDIQCHSMTHESLDEFTKGSMKENFEALEKEISQSKALIENNLSKQCNYFSYPGGKPNSLISELLKKQGYRGAFTYNRGGNPFFVDNYMINRSIIYGSRDLKGFKKSLEIFCESILE
jgi:peptidoglycan/xylan/chitin deacetylase (PgdA/CDA1 family)